MEGKDCYSRYSQASTYRDIEVNEKDPEKFIRTVKAISPTFGGINLEDIKAPECFEIETRLKNELDIPVMHDDQHGTAIISGAGLINALEIAGKKIEDVKSGERRRSRLYLMYETVRDAGARRRISSCATARASHLYQPPGLERRQAGVRYRPSDSRPCRRPVGADVFWGLRGERIDQGDGMA